MSREVKKATPKVGLALTFVGPGCWMWRTEYGHEGVAGTREQAIEAAKDAMKQRAD